jgi:hypothetical protein
MPCRSSILSARAASIRLLSRRSCPSRIRFEQGGVALVVLRLAYSKGPHDAQFIALLGEQFEQAKLACRRTSSSVSLGVRRMRRVFSAATPRLTTRARGALPRPTQRQWPMRIGIFLPDVGRRREPAIAKNSSYSTGKISVRSGYQCTVTRLPASGCERPNWFCTSATRCWPATVKR